MIKILKHKIIVKYFILTTIILLLLFSCNGIKDSSDKEEKKEKKHFLIKKNWNLKPDDVVLAPSKSSFDSAISNGLENSLFVFYPRTVIKQLKDSVVLNQIGDTVLMPNSLVIPLQENKKAVAGDIVLTWWQSGTGMQRAIVLNKDSSYTPVVYYIDNQYSFYSAVTDVKFWIDTLAPNSFVVLKDSMMSGRSIRVKKEYYSTFYIVINVTNKKVLALSWAGNLELFDIQKCQLVPFSQNFEKGDSVSVPYLGTYSQGTVKTVWPDIGKIKVKILFIDEYLEIYANMFDSFKIDENDE